MIMNRTKSLMNISIFGVTLNILLNYILIKHFGLGNVGAAIATLISFFALNIIISLILYRISKIHPLTPQYIKPIILSSIIGLAIYAIAKSFPLYIWLLPIYLFLYLAGYFVSLLITKSFEEDDRRMFEMISEKTGFKMDIIRKFLCNSIK
jgi:O-antigen/teichoic acid export membrane protein